MSLQHVNIVQGLLVEESDVPWIVRLLMKVDSE
jgi:hypothetical protein